MPFFGRIHGILNDFCSSSDDSISIELVCENIQQLVDNKLRPKPIQMPEDFLDDEDSDEEDADEESGLLPPIYDE